MATGPTRTGSAVADLRTRVTTLETRGQGVTAGQLSDEAHARADADAAEALARADADNALAARQASLTGVLSLPAGLALVGGKTVRTLAVTGLKKGDGIVVTPAVALPTGVALAEATCLANGTLSVSLVTVGLVTINAKTDIDLKVTVLR